MLVFLNTCFFPVSRLEIKEGRNSTGNTTDPLCGTGGDHEL